MGLGDLFTLEKEFKEKLGDYLMAELIPEFMVLYENARGFTKDNKFEMCDSYAIWTDYIGGKDDCKKLYLDNDIDIMIIQECASHTAITRLVDKNEDKRDMIFFQRKNSELKYPIMNIENFSIYTEGMLFFIPLFDAELAKRCD